MNGFELYSLNTWTTDGLSIHPPAPPTANESRQFRGYLAKIAVPLLAIASFGISQATLAGNPAAMVQGAGLNSVRVAPPTGQISLTSAPITAAHSSFPLGSAEPLDFFKAHQSAQQSDLLMTGLPLLSSRGVSAETLRLAGAVATRHADADSSKSPAWVQEVANAVAALDD